MQPNRIQLLGGEPLMHPNLIEIIDNLCKIYPHPINLTTNGVMLPEYRRKKELLALFDNYPQLELVVSRHIPMPAALEFMRKHNIPHRIDRRLFRETGMGMMDSNKYFAFYSQNEQQSCCPTHRCRAIVDDRLHRCSRHASRVNLVKYGLNNGRPIQDQEYINTVNQWNGISLVDATPMEIRNYLTEYPFEECRLCPIKPQRHIQCQMPDQEYHAMFKKFENK